MIFSLVANTLVGFGIDIDNFGSYKKNEKYLKKHLKEFLKLNLVNLKAIDGVKNDFADEVIHLR